MKDFLQKKKDLINKIKEKVKKYGCWSCHSCDCLSYGWDRVEHLILTTLKHQI